MAHREAQYPNQVFDGVSTGNLDRLYRNSNVNPNYCDYDQLAAEVMATQTKLDEGGGGVSTTLYVGSPESYIELGTQDAYSRYQIWNYMPDSILRLGSSQADGDPLNVESEGQVVYGKNLEGDPMGTSDFAYMRIKPDRVGLYNSKLAGYAGYLFRIDLSSNDCYLRDDSGVKTLEFDRRTGALKIVNLQATGLPIYVNNAAAAAGGLAVGAFYRTGADPDPVCVVH